MSNYKTLLSSQNGIQHSRLRQVSSEVGNADGQPEESQYPLLTLDSDEEDSLVTLTENCSTSENNRRPLVQHEKEIASEPIGHEKVVEDICRPIEEQKQAPHMNVKEYPSQCPSPDSLKRASPFSVGSKHSRNESYKSLMQASAPSKEAHDVNNRHPSLDSLRRASPFSVGCGSDSETAVHKTVNHQKVAKASHSNYFLDRTEQMLPDSHFKDYPSLQHSMDSPQRSPTFHFRYRSPSPESEDCSRSPGHHVHKSRPRRSVEWHREKGPRPRLGSRSPTRRCRDRPRRRKISDGRSSGRGQPSPEGSPQLPRRRVLIPTSKNWIKFPKPVPPVFRAALPPAEQCQDLGSDFDQETVVRKLNWSLQQTCQSDLLNELVASMRKEEEDRREQEDRKRQEKRRVLDMLAYKANIGTLAEHPPANAYIQPPPSHSPPVMYPQQINSPAPRAVVLPLRRAAFSQMSPYEMQPYRLDFQGPPQMQACHPYAHHPYRRFPLRCFPSGPVPPTASSTLANPVLANPSRCLRNVPVLSEEELSNSKEAEEELIAKYCQCRVQYDRRLKTLQKLMSEALDLKKMKEEFENSSTKVCRKTNVECISEFQALQKVLRNEQQVCMQEKKRLFQEMAKLEKRIKPEKLQSDTQVQDEQKPFEVYGGVDSEPHYCADCDRNFRSISSMIQHLQTAEHRQRVGSFQSVATKMPSTAKTKATSLHPVKGLEFVQTVDAFYCSLCEEILLNESFVEQHVQGHDHTLKYQNLLEENPIYEEKRHLKGKVRCACVGKEGMPGKPAEETTIKANQEDADKACQEQAEKIPITARQTGRGRMRIRSQQVALNKLKDRATEQVAGDSLDLPEEPDDARPDRQCPPRIAGRIKLMLAFKDVPEVKEHSAASSEPKISPSPLNCDQVAVEQMDELQRRESVTEGGEDSLLLGIGESDAVQMPTPKTPPARLQQGCDSSAQHVMPANSSPPSGVVVPPLNSKPILPLPSVAIPQPDVRVSAPNWQVPPLSLQGPLSSLKDPSPDMPFDRFPAQPQLDCYSEVTDMEVEDGEGYNIHVWVPESVSASAFFTSTPISSLAGNTNKPEPFSSIASLDIIRWRDGALRTTKTNPGISQAHSGLKSLSYCKVGSKEDKFTCSEVLDGIIEKVYENFSGKISASNCAYTSCLHQICEAQEVDIGAEEKPKNPSLLQETEIALQDLVCNNPVVILSINEESERMDVKDPVRKITIEAVSEPSSIHSSEQFIDSNLAYQTSEAQDMGVGAVESPKIQSLLQKTEIPLQDLVSNRTDANLIVNDELEKMNVEEPIKEINIKASSESSIHSTEQLLDSNLAFQTCDEQDVCIGTEESPEIESLLQKTEIPLQDLVSNRADESLIVNDELEKNNVEEPIKEINIKTSSESSIHSIEQFLDSTLAFQTCKEQDVGINSDKSPKIQSLLLETKILVQDLVCNKPHVILSINEKSERMDVEEPVKEITVEAVSEPSSIHSSEQFLDSNLAYQTCEVQDVGIGTEESPIIESLLQETKNPWQDLVSNSANGYLTLNEESERMYVEEPVKEITVEAVFGSSSIHSTEQFLDSNLTYQTCEPQDVGIGAEESQNSESLLKETEIPLHDLVSNRSDGSLIINDESEGMDFKEPVKDISIEAFPGASLIQCTEDLLASNLYYQTCDKEDMVIVTEESRKNQSFMQKKDVSLQNKSTGMQLIQEAENLQKSPTEAPDKNLLDSWFSTTGSMDVEAHEPAKEEIPFEAIKNTQILGAEFNPLESQVSDIRSIGVGVGDMLMLTQEFKDDQRKVCAELTGDSGNLLSEKNSMDSSFAVVDSFQECVADNLELLKTELVNILPEEEMETLQMDSGKNEDTDECPMDMDSSDNENNVGNTVRKEEKSIHLSSDEVSALDDECLVQI